MGLSKEPIITIAKLEVSTVSLPIHLFVYVYDTGTLGKKQKQTVFVLTKTKKWKGGEVWMYRFQKGQILFRVVCGIRDNLVTQTATVLIDLTKG